jgi:hypothetical protein
MLDCNHGISTNSLSRRTLLERSLALGIGIGNSAILTALNACGDSGSGNTHTNAPITLTAWDYSIDHADTLLQRYENFTKLHPGIKIQRTYIPYANMNQKVLLAMAAGTLPDLLLVDSLSHPTYSANGVLLDLTDRIKAWGQIDSYVNRYPSSPPFLGRGQAPSRAGRSPNTSRLTNTCRRYMRLGTGSAQGPHPASQAHPTPT